MLKKSIKNELFLLGTKGGPAIRPNGSMPSSSLLILDKKKILVDAGLGVSKSLTEINFNLNELSNIDDITSLPEEEQLKPEIIEEEVYDDPTVYNDDQDLNDLLNRVDDLLNSYSN